MKTIEWVRREIELACKNETEKCKANPDYQEGDEETLRRNIRRIRHDQV